MKKTSLLWQWVALFAIAIGLIAIRNPLYLLSPRIWAEEGSVFLSSALSVSSGWSILFPHLGYYSFFNNAIALLAAKLFPLAYAAHVTTYASLLLQLATIGVIFSARGRLVSPGFAGALVALSPLIFSTPEVWLTTTSAHYWLATGSYFVLNSFRLCTFSSAYVVVSFLTGAGILFYPFYCIRFIKDRSPQCFLLVVAGGFSALFNLFSFITHLTSGNSTGRLILTQAINMIAGLKEVIVPFSLRHGVGLAYLPLLFFCVVVFIRYSFSRGDRELLLFTLLPLLLYSFFVVLLSVGMSGGTRHGLPVYSGFFAVIIAATVSCSQASIRYFLISLTCFFVLVKLHQFFDTSYLYSSSWPQWHQQVAGRAGCQAMTISIFPQWPDHRWTMDIPAHRGLPCR